jgi:hypothetical protein
MIETLTEKKCTPCRGGVPQLTLAEAEHFRSQTPNWELLVWNSFLIRWAANDGRARKATCKSSLNEPSLQAWRRQTSSNSIAPS